LPLIYHKQGVGGYLPSLAIQRNQEFIDGMTLPMRNLANMRYYLLPLDTPPFGEPLPPWWDNSEPDGGLTIDLLGQQPSVPSMQIARIEITSYTDQTIDLPDGFMAGELVLGSPSGETITRLIRLGMETADWAQDGFAPNVKHKKPSQAIAFPAYLKSLGKAFNGNKYITKFEVGSSELPVVLTSIGAHSFLPTGGLNIERIDLIDEVGHSVSLASLLHRNELTLAFRSHAAAMWENQDVMPRSFIVHQAEVVNGEESLRRVQEAQFSLSQRILLSDAPLSASMPNSNANANDQASVAEYKSERVVVNVSTGQAGYLMLTDTWYPGWQAWVDGVETPIYRADYIYRAVPVQPGSHSIVFEYHPMSFMLGLLVSGLTIVLLCGFAIWSFRHA
jgi:hypothetical protein